MKVLHYKVVTWFKVVILVPCMWVQTVYRYNYVSKGKSVHISKIKITHVTTVNRPEGHSYMYLPPDTWAISVKLPISTHTYTQSIKVVTCAWVIWQAYGPKTHAYILVKSWVHIVTTDVMYPFIVVLLHSPLDIMVNTNV